MRVYHDFVSPYCRLVAALLAARHDEAASGVGGGGSVSIRWNPFELSPPGAPEIRADDEAFADQLAKARERAAEWGIDPDAGLRPPTVLPRTRKAHEAVAFARRAAGRGDAESGLDTRLVAELYHALWRDGRDIGRVDEVVEVAAAAGVDREPLYVALGLDELEADVRADQDAAEAAGVAGVPVLVRDAPAEAAEAGPGAGDVLVGLTDRDVLDEWLAGAGRAGPPGPETAESSSDEEDTSEGAEG